MKTFRVASWNSRSHFVFIKGASERCCWMAYVLLGQFCCSLYIYEKAIVQIIIRADLVLIAPPDILYICIKRKDTVVHIVRIRSFLILQQTLLGREMLLIMFWVPSETMFFGIKPEKSRRRFLPYSYRFLPLPCCRPKKSRKIFQGAKRCLLAPCPFRAIFSWKIIAKTFGGNGKSP